MIQEILVYQTPARSRVMDNPRRGHVAAFGRGGADRHHDLVSSMTDNGRRLVKTHDHLGSKHGGGHAAARLLHHRTFRGILRYALERSRGRDCQSARRYQRIKRPGITKHRLPTITQRTTFIGWPCRASLAVITCAPSFRRWWSSSIMPNQRSVANSVSVRVPINGWIRQPATGRATTLVNGWQLLQTIFQALRLKRAIRHIEMRMVNE